MPTRLVQVVVDATDPSSLAKFWAAALGWEMVFEADDEVEVAPNGYSSSDSAVPLCFVAVPDAKTVKNRVHLDLSSQSPEDQAAIVERLQALGAQPVDIGQADAPWIVLADPEGNEFCVLDPRDVYRDVGPMASILLDCADPERLADFWSVAAGWDVIRRAPDGRWVSLRSPTGSGPYMDLIRVPDVKQVKNRVHLDVAPFPDDDHATEVERLRALGATEIDVGQAEVSWVVLADPEGNELCVLTPR